MYTTEEERGRIICEGLAWYGITGDWTLDFDGELFLLINRKIYRCLGKREINNEILPYWGEVKPTVKSIYMRQIGKRKLDYNPVYSELEFSESN